MGTEARPGSQNLDEFAAWDFHDGHSTLNGH
jgi:hypothetical protein